jgi:hypothetical protein
MRRRQAQGCRPERGGADACLDEADGAAGSGRGECRPGAAETTRRGRDTAWPGHADGRLPGYQDAAGISRGPGLAQELAEPGCGGELGRRTCGCRHNSAQEGELHRHGAQVMDNFLHALLSPHRCSTSTLPPLTFPHSKKNAGSFDFRSTPASERERSAAARPSGGMRTAAGGESTGRQGGAARRPRKRAHGSGRSPREPNADEAEACTGAHGRGARSSGAERCRPRERRRDDARRAAQTERRAGAGARGRVRIGAHPICRNAAGNRSKPMSFV